MKVYIVFDGDHIGRMVGRATLDDKPDEVRILSQRIDQGNQLFKLWAESFGGNVINIGGDEGRLEVDATRLGELPGIREQYEGAVGATCSVGVGMALSLAQKALVAAKAKGGDQIVFYSPEVDQILADLQEKSEGGKIADEYLNKSAVGSGGLAPQHRLVGGASGDSSEVDSLMAQLEGDPDAAGEPGQVPAAPSPDIAGMQDEFHKLAGQQTQPAPPSNVSDAVKAKIVGIIEFMQQHPEQLQLLKLRNPDLYNSVNQLISAMIEMARKGTGGAPPEEVRPETADEMTKAALEAGKTGRHAVILPVGTTKEPSAGGDNKPQNANEKKVQTADGKSHWVSVAAGVVMSPGGQATSSRNPAGIKPPDAQEGQS